MPAPHKLFSRIESMNIHGRERNWSFMPDDLARRARPRLEHVGDGLLTAMRGSDSLHINRVIGLGHRGAARPGVIDDILAIAREQKLRRIRVELAPSAQAGAIERWLLSRGFRRHGGYSMLVRDLRIPVPAIPKVPRVVRAGPTRIATVVDIFATAFPVPASRMAWQLAAARRGGTRYFLALWGSTPIGAGALRIEDDLGWLIGGATLTRWRHRGSHAALIVARLCAARRHGCRHAWTETSLPVPGRPQGSRRNMLRLGFEELGVKKAFVWESTASPRVAESAPPPRHPAGRSTRRR